MSPTTEPVSRFTMFSGIDTDDVTRSQRNGGWGRGGEGERGLQKRRGSKRKPRGTVRAETETEREREREKERERESGSKVNRTESGEGIAKGGGSIARP